MAFFNHPVAYPDHAARAVQTALTVMQAVRSDNGHTPLPVGAGIATGEALVGNVGSGEANDFTALGDVVNVAARLQGAAQAGELLVTEDTYRLIAAQFPDAPARDLDLKGKSDLVRARVLSVDG